MFGFFVIVWFFGVFLFDFLGTLFCGFLFGFGLVFQFSEEILIQYINENIEFF